MLTESDKQRFAEQDAIDAHIDGIKAELANVTAELATLRESTRIRVTAEEPPTGDDEVLAYVENDDDGVAWWDVAPACTVRVFPNLCTHWLPLPERPAR